MICYHLLIFNYSTKHLSSLDRSLIEESSQIKLHKKTNQQSNLRMTIVNKILRMITMMITKSLMNMIRFQNLICLTI